MDEEEKERLRLLEELFAESGQPDPAKTETVEEESVPEVVEDPAVEEPEVVQTPEPEEDFDLFAKIDEIEAQQNDPRRIAYQERQQALQTEVDNFQKTTDTKFKEDGESSTWLDRRRIGFTNAVFTTGEAVSAISSLAAGKLGFEDVAESFDDVRSGFVELKKVNTAAIPTKFKGEGVKERVDAFLGEDGQLNYDGVGKKVEVEVTKDGTFEDLRDEDNLKIDIKKEGIDKFNSTKAENKKRIKDNIFGIGDIDALQTITNAEGTFYEMASMLVGGGAVAKLGSKAITRGYVGSAAFIQSYGKNYEEALQKTKGDVDKSLDNAAKKSLATGILSFAFAGLETSLIGKLGSKGQSALVEAKTKAIAEFAEGTVNKAGMFTSVFDKLKTAGVNVGQEQIEEVADLLAGTLIDNVTGVDDKGITQDALEETIVTTFFASAPFGAVNAMTDPSKNQSLTNSAYAASQNPDNFDDVMDGMVENFRESGATPAAISKFEDEAVAKKKIVRNLANNLAALPDLKDEQKLEIVRDLVLRDKLAEGLDDITNPVIKASKETKLEELDEKLAKKLNVDDGGDIKTTTEPTEGSTEVSETVSDGETVSVLEKVPGAPEETTTSDGTTETENVVGETTPKEIALFEKNTFVDDLNSQLQDGEVLVNSKEKDEDGNIIKKPIKVLNEVDTLNNLANTGELTDQKLFNSPLFENLTETQLAVLKEDKANLDPDPTVARIKFVAELTEKLKTKETPNSIPAEKPKSKKSRNVEPKEVTLPNNPTSKNIEAFKDASKLTSDDVIFDSIMDLDPENVKFDVSNAEADGLIKGNTTGITPISDYVQLEKRVQKKVANDEALSTREFAFAKKFNTNFKNTKPKVQIPITKEGRDRIKKAKFTKEETVVTKGNVKNLSTPNAKGEPSKLVKAIEQAFNPDKGDTIKTTKTKKVKIKNENFDVETKKFNEDKADFDKKSAELKDTVQERFDKAKKEFDSSKSAGVVNTKAIKLGDVIKDIDGPPRHKGKRYEVIYKGSNTWSLHEVDSNGKKITGGERNVESSRYTDFTKNGARLVTKGKTTSNKPPTLEQFEKEVEAEIKQLEKELPKKPSLEIDSDETVEIVTEKPTTEAAEATATLYNKVVLNIAKRLGKPASQVWEDILGGVVKTTTQRANEESNKVRNQGNRGAVIGLDDGPKILAALEDPNKSTALHELAHLFENWIDVISEGARDTVLDDYNKFNNLEGDVKLETWDRDVSEFFAKSWEKYLRDPADNSIAAKMKGIFDTFSQWLRDIYKDGIKFKGKDLTVSKQMQSIFDQLLDPNIKRIENVTIEKTPKITIRDDSRTFTSKDRTEAIQKSGKELLEAGKEFKLAGKKANQAETRRVADGFGLELTGHQRSRVMDIISRAVDEGLHHLANAEANAKAFLTELLLHDKGIINITPNLSVEQVVGIAAASQRLADVINTERRAVNKARETGVNITASATVKKGKYFRQDGKWGNLVDEVFTEASDQKSLDSEYQVQQLARMEFNLTKKLEQERNLLNALERSASLAGQALGFLGKTIDGVVSQASQLAKRFKRDTGKEATAKINDLANRMEVVDKQQRKIRAEIANGVKETRTRSASKNIKNNGKRKVDTKKADLIKDLKALYKTSNNPISFQSIDDVPYNEDLQKMQDLLTILTNENPSLDLEGLMNRAREVLGADKKNQTVNEDIINALIMADPKAKKKAISEAAKQMAANKKRAKGLKKITNRLRDIIDPNKRKNRNKQLKEFDKLISQLEQSTLLENGMPHDDGALAMAQLQRMRDLYGNLGFDKTIAGTMQFNDLVKDLANIRKTLQEKQEIGLGNTILRELDAILNNELSLTPKTETTKTKELKKLLVNLKNGDFRDPESMLKQLNSLRTEFGESILTDKQFDNLQDKITKFKGVKNDFTKVTNLVKKIKGTLDARFPAKRTSANSDIHNRIQDIKAMINNAVDAKGPLNEASISAIIDEFAEIQKTLPDVDDFASDELRQFITDLKMRDDKLTDNIETVRQWLNDEVKTTAKNKAARIKLDKLLREVKVGAGGKVPESTLDTIEQLINELMSDTKSADSFEKATINAIRDSVDQYEDAVRIGKIRNDIKRLEGIQQDIADGKADAIASIQPGTSKVILNSELLRLRKIQRRIMEAYRKEVEVNSTPGQKAQAFYDNLTNTYRNLILTFDLSALGIQVGQLLAAEVGGAARGYATFNSSEGTRRILNAGKIAATSLSSLKEAGYEKAMNEIINSNAFTVSQNLDIPLELNGITDGIVTEEFDASFIDKVKGLKSAKDLAERTFNATIATARFKAFETFYINNPTATRAQLSEFANHVNTRSGAAQFSGTSSKKSKSILNSIFIAPRLYYSTFKSMANIMINMAQLGLDNRGGIAAKKGVSKILNLANAGIDTTQFETLSPGDRRLLSAKNAENLNTVAGFVIFHGALAIINSLAGDEDDRDPLTKNPVSGNFMAIRNNDFSLNSSYLIPYMRLISKLAHQLGILEDSVDNQLAENRNYTRQDGKEMWFNFLKYKLSPLSGLLLTGLKNQNAIRQPLNVKTDAEGMEKYTQEYAWKGSAYNFATQSFPLPISIRGGIDVVHNAWFKKETLSAGNTLEDSPTLKAATGALLNVMGVSGHSMGNQARSVFANEVFKVIDRNPPSPGTLLKKDFPAIFKKTDMNGDANALGHFLTNETQNEVGAYLQRARIHRGMSISDIRPEKIEALTELLNTVARQAAKYHMTRLNKKYELSTVPVKYKNTHKINWEAYDTRLDNLLKAPEPE